MIEKIPGKYYVLDQFNDKGEPLAGPFDTREEAEAERVQLNIADDCFVGRYNPPKQTDIYDSVPFPL